MMDEKTKDKSPEGVCAQWYCVCLCSVGQAWDRSTGKEA